MGMYLNPGKQRFQIAINSEIYVDKTGLINHLNSVINTNQRYVSVSRPRRFGKTMAADMICAYYDRTADSREIFENRKIATNSDECVSPWDINLNKYDTIRLVMTDFIKTDVDVKESLKRLSRRILDELHQEYPSVTYEEDDFSFSFEKFYAESKRQYVIIIDEWDAIFRIRLDDKVGQKQYLDFLRDWLKDKEFVALAYMTGILPIKKYGEHSALNMFDEYSMTQPMQLAEYTGFTKSEVEKLCEVYNMDYSEIESWYDGYKVSDNVPVSKRQLYREGKYEGHIIDIYSPLSVVNAVSSGLIKNYWNKTESYEALAEYIRRDYDGLKEDVTLLMNGGSVKINTSSYQNDMTTFNSKDDILSLLIHLGYLGFDDNTNEVYIPNEEVMDVFKVSTQNKEWVGYFKAFEKSEELLKYTWVCDENKVADLLEEFHNKASNKPDFKRHSCIIEKA
ncbi:Predicted AAA-ATPase [Pseudobutyrivibrio sp. ACV-2]|uniref:AAA family ATPase n=1 Tax=Pseudobutyrivibrio sp. ACV-2 TaxID=1520801 RepID=UPI00089CFB6D|nr:AAA family ATPase [Pseudobutyrivibrio sp. ACV-2]SEA47809.1 Predicted AAA-ATPase [Pseudobutyrivibrio sp. ACV-2]